MYDASCKVQGTLDDGRHQTRAQRCKSVMYSEERANAVQGIEMVTGSGNNFDLNREAIAPV